MRVRRLVSVLAALSSCLAFAADVARAQSTTGTISGRIVDQQDLPVPGATVNVQSPSLQGIRSAFTSENGDYILAGLPSGVYHVAFELSGFETQTRTITLAPTQVLPLDATLGPAALSAQVDVVGRSADVLTHTAQVATNFAQSLLADLPTNRDINASLLMAPGVQPTGPSGQYSIAGAMSFESLFLINGATVNDNFRGYPNVLFIEDAIQETTVATGGISAEYGRFSGGVVNVITKSGGNQFSGSFRDTLINDNWRALTPFLNDTKLDATVPTYEYTLGGPVFRDHLWFFTAGRIQNQSISRATAAPLRIPYVSEINSKRYEGKATFSFSPTHRVQGSFIKLLQDDVNAVQSTTTALDLNSLYTRRVPQDLFTLSYNGILSPRLSVEGRYSHRNLAFEGTGAKTRDLIDGTLIVDRSRGGLRYWSPTFCGVCPPEQRDNQDIFLKGTYFLSTPTTGAHTVVAGYDNFDDQHFANSRQSGSDYRILGTSAIIRGTDIYPQFIGGNDTTIIQWNPVNTDSERNHFRTHSLFVSDQWHLNSHFTFNLGLRWDKNSGVDAAGNRVAKDSALSPRLGVIWDPRGDGVLAVTGSVSRYVAGVNNSLASASSATGSAANLQWPYNGPDVNANSNAALTATPAALRQVFDWFFQNNIASTTPSVSEIPGVSIRIPDGLTSPNAVEYAAGISRTLSARAVVRADYTFRDYRDFYSARIDPSTGSVVNRDGVRSDLQIFENTNDAKRRYSGATFSGTYRVGTLLDVGGNYTLSRLWGNIDGEAVNGGPVPVDFDRYPEYHQLEWYAPEGDLSADQRHRARFWANYRPAWTPGLTLSMLHDYGSGVPYGAAPGPNSAAPPFPGVDARSYVANPPPYVTPQGATSQQVLLHRPRCVPDGVQLQDRCRRQLQLRPADGGAEGRPVHPGARHQSVQRGSAVRLRQRRVSEWRRRVADANQSDGADCRERSGDLPAIQPVHRGTGRRGELGKGREFRAAHDSNGIHLAARLLDGLWDPVLAVRAGTSRDRPWRLARGTDVEHPTQLASPAAATPTRTSARHVRADRDRPDRELVPGQGAGWQIHDWRAAVTGLRTDTQWRLPEYGSAR